MTPHTLIIAEAGVNHNGSLETALRLVDAAAEAGADYVKFQTFKAENLVTKGAVQAEYQKRNIGSNDADNSQLQMLRHLELSAADHEAIIEHCRQRGIRFLSTAFDMDSVGYLASLGLGVWKVPSGEITNYPYLAAIASYGQPVIMSTGMCDYADIEQAMRVLTSHGLDRSQITLLHCNTEYPTPMADVNLRAMIDLKRRFGVDTGYSDHTLGIEVPVAAVAMGATVIEKHFTLDRSMPGPDHKASLTPAELKQMVSAIRNVELAMGTGKKCVTASESNNRPVARKSIVAKSHIMPGDEFSPTNLTVKRPGTGLSPMAWPELIGAKATKEYQPDQMIDEVPEPATPQAHKRKICFITGTRAEYGLLRGIMRLVQESAHCQLQVIATNMHLLPEYGETYREIEADGFKIDEKVAMRKPADDAYGILESMSAEMLGMTDAMRRLQPDIAVVLGDRYEMLVAATCAMMLRIPIAHIHGGEVSQGAIDDSIRNAITMMSSLHFASTEEYKQRILDMGGNPNHTFCVGAPGVENINKIEIMPQAVLEAELGFTLGPGTIMATYHPATRGQRSAAAEIADFLSALDAFPDLRVLFTMPNSDQGGEEIAHAIETYCAKNQHRCKAFHSLGLKRYLSALRYVDAVIGNSSSGLIEAPSAHIPTLNIGIRQRGRARGESVLDCPSDRDSIIRGITTVLSPAFKEIAARAENPYDKPGTAQAIFEKIIRP